MAKLQPEEFGSCAMDEGMVQHFPKTPKPKKMMSMLPLLVAVACSFQE
jgi:hypothetical protein